MAYSSAILPWLDTDRARWKRLAPGQDTRYLPAQENSVKFTTGMTSGGKQEAPSTLPRLQGQLVDGVATIHCGGPVWSLAWCPQGGEDQHLALSGHCTPEATACDAASGPEPGLLQVWTFRRDKVGNVVGAATLSQGIGHSYGRVWDLEWCPSGMWEAPGSGSRLGGLAAACSDGTVRLFVLHHAQQPGQLWEREADRTLTPGPAGTVGHCLSLSWYRGPGHRYLAACYASGLVCLWDLAASSPLLVRAAAELLPIHSWQAHNSKANSIAFCSSETEIPQYAVTGGNDRCYKFWDLRDTAVPIQEVKRGLVTDVRWISVQPSAAVSFDDVYQQTHTQTLVTEGDGVSSRAFTVIAQNSAIWSQSVSPWLGSLAVGSAAGELRLFVLPPMSQRSLDQTRAVCKRREYVYRIEQTLDCDPDTTDCNDYNGLADRCTLHFLDMFKTSDRRMLEEQARLRIAERMPVEQLAGYPLASLNRVAWNPNLGSHCWLASGSQAGLVRIHSLASLNTPAVQAAVKSFLKKR